MKRTLDFGSWPSALRAADIAQGMRRFSQPQWDRGFVHWLEARPSERGRQAVMRARPGEGGQELSARNKNVRTRVHEYGGGDYLVAAGELFSVSFDDQVLYRGLDPLTQKGPRYADMARSSDGRWLIAVEESPCEGTEPKNRLVAFDLVARSASARVVVAEGHDFYSSPCFRADGTMLTFIAWDHPDMPWDSTVLYGLAWGPKGTEGTPRRFAGGSGESIVQPRYSPSGKLCFVSDRSGFWNLYQQTDGDDIALSPREAEFAQPHWVFGLRNYDFVDADRILCSYRDRDGDRLGILHCDAGQIEEISLPFSDLGGICCEGRQAAFLGASPNHPSGLYVLDLDTLRYRLVRSGSENDWDEALVSSPETVEFPTAGGQSAHAFFYPPFHTEVEGPARSKPPLLVKSHGGPTSQATCALDPRIPYWTNRGFAVVDVNYRGSTGYGRVFREQLAGQWGVADVDDCVAAAQFLVAQGRADAERLVISGGSAGGYTTLCALTFRDVFRAGASHYGIGDLEALVRDTHKFESRYLDKLVGPYPDARDLYRERSPIHHTEGLNCPVIFFQGLEDRVVPPSQAEAMVEALSRQGIRHAYVPFEGEQHGFRKAENVVAALEGELYFYSRVLGFEVGVRPPGVRIEV